VNTTQTTLGKGIHIKFDIVLKGLVWANGAEDGALGLKFAFQNTMNSDTPKVTSEGIYYPNNSAYIDVGDEETNTVHAILRSDGTSSSYWMMIPHFGDLAYDPNVATVLREVSSSSCSSVPTTSSSTKENSTPLVDPNGNNLKMIIIICSVVGAVVLLVALVVPFIYKKKKNALSEDEEPFLMGQ